MAFGDVKGTFTGGNNSIPNPLPLSLATGSAVVAVGDLIVALCAQQTALTVTGCGDNLHGASSYSAQNAGTLSTVSGRLFYMRVTVAGTITAINFVTTASANDGSGCAVTFEGPFIVSPLDATPGNLSADLATPYSCPASGALAQANEVIVGWMAAASTAVHTAGGGFTKRTEQLQSANAASKISSLTVAATTTQTPTWTGTAPTADVLGTASFKKDPVTQKSISLTTGQTEIVLRSIGQRETISQPNNASGTVAANILAFTSYTAGLQNNASGSAVAHFPSSQTGSGLLQDAFGVAEVTVLLSQIGTGLVQVISKTANFVAGGGGGVTQKVINVLQSMNAFGFVRAATHSSQTGSGLTQDINGVAEATISISQTGTGMAEAITLTRLRSGGTQKIINVIQAQAVSLRRSLIHLVNVLQAQTIIMFRRALDRLVIIVTGQQLIIRRDSVSHRIIVAGMSELVTLARVFAKNNILNVTQAQVVLLRRATGHLLLVTQSQLVFMLRAIGHIVTLTAGQLNEVITRRITASRIIVITMAETVTFARVFAKNKINNITQAQLASLRRAAGHRITLTQNQAISVVRNYVTPFTNKIINILTGQNTSSVAEGNKLISQTGTAIGQAITLVENFVSGGPTQKILNFLLGQNASGVAEATISVSQTGGGLGQLITATKARVAAGGKLINVFIGQNVFGFGRAATHSSQTGSGLLQNVSGVAEANIPVSQTGTGIGQLITVTKNFISGIADVVISITQSFFHYVTIQANKYLTFSGPGLAQNVWGYAVGHIRSTQTGGGLSQLITLTKNFVAGGPAATQKIISLTQDLVTYAVAEAHIIRTITGSGLHQSIRLIRATFTGHRITILQGQLISLRRNLAKLILISMAQAVTVTKSAMGIVFKAITLTQAQLVTLRLAMRRIITITMGQLITRLTSVGHRIAISMAEVVTLFRSFARSKILSITQAQLVTLRLSLGKLISVLQAQLVSLRSNIGKIIRLELLQLSQVIIRFVAINRIIRIFMAQTVTLVASKALNKLLNIIQAQLVTLRRGQFGKFISVAMAQSVTLLRSTRKIIIVVMGQTVSILRVLPQRIVVGMGQLITLFTSAHAIHFRTIIAPIGQVVSLFFDTFFKPIRKITQRRGGGGSGIRPDQLSPSRPGQEHAMRPHQPTDKRPPQ